ncbi:transcription factor IIIA-like [Limulus polyphemus]|uniref:Transcription factor IIIA-like n=1 Tax=Limulus polyphemus TaxID=6850 RepID=A0ABM1TK65_LIMPO|nr:transcription factor IIIA-like [Limulus polyphemus]XP_022256271.1 transcription factor IIIA-like [Limulus polyphemus]
MTNVMCAHSEPVVLEKPKASREKCYVCSFDDCTASFSRPCQLETHLRAHTGERPFICTYDDCYSCYTRVDHLKRHIAKCHEAKIVNTFTCEYEQCGKVLSSIHSLERHMKTHEKRSYKCPTCKKAFLKHQHLKIHSFEHTGIKPFHCVHDGCGRTFVLPSKLKSHMKSHKGYTCDSPGCEENFSKWTHFRRHKKLCHPQKHECEVCQRRFFTKSNLRAHAETHKTDREIFCCPHEGCSFSYFQEKNLRAHVTSYHEKKRHACTIEGCERTFISKGGLKKHIKLHELGRSFPPKNRNKRKKRLEKRRKLWHLFYLDTQSLRRKTNDLVFQTLQ